MKKFTLLFSVLIILSIQLSVAQRLESSAKYAENPKTKPAVSPLFLHSENNVISKEIMCMNDALFSNAPVGFTTALTSNTDVGYIVAQYVENFDYSISAMRFFGIQGFYNGISWVAMNDTEVMNFDISFYADDAGKPGTLLHTEIVSLSHNTTGSALFNTYDVFYWDFTPASSIGNLPVNFWVSFANTETDIWFLAVDKPGGLGRALQLNAGVWGATVAQTIGLCIVPELPAENAPSKPTDFQIFPDIAGGLNADVIWNNPETDVLGNVLAELTSVVLFQDDVEIYSNLSPVIGGSESVFVTVSDEGYYKFKVQGFNSAGFGEFVKTTVWIGEDYPASVTDLTHEKIGDMEASVSWTAPYEGMHGEYFSGANLTYDIYRFPGNVPVSDNQTETTYSEIFTEAGNYYYVVIPQNLVGEGISARSNSILYGDFVVFQTFDETTLPTDWTGTGNGFGNNWNLSFSSYAGGEANELAFTWDPLMSGRTNYEKKINTFGVESLNLEFKHSIDNYPHTDPMFVGVATSSDNGETWNEIWSLNPSASVASETKNFMIDNTDVGSPNFIFAFYFEGATKDMNYWFIDNVMISANYLPGAFVTFNVTDTDGPVKGALVSILGNEDVTDVNGQITYYLTEGTDLPYTISKFGYEDYSGTVTVTDQMNVDVDVTMSKLPIYSAIFNVKNSELDLINAEVTLYFEGNVYANGLCTDGTITFTEIPTGDYSYDVVYQGYNSDLNHAFTISDNDVTFDIQLTEQVTDPYGLMFQVLNEDIDVRLSWNNIFGFSDSFETYPDFSLSYSPWTNYDIDATPTFGLDGTDFINETEPMAGIIFNPSATTPPLTSPAYNGQKYLAFFNADFWTTTDDWAITPKVLVPEDAIVQFYARAGIFTYPSEKFQVFVSTTGKDIADFTPISAIETTPGSIWKKYSYSLAGYAKQEIYVAIHVTTYDQFYLCVDNVYIGSSARNLNPVSYDVFLDGTLLTTDAATTDNEWMLNDLAPGTYTAGIKAYYDTGESQTSEIVITLAGVDIQTNDDTSISIFPNPSNGMFSVTSKYPVEMKISDISGKILQQEHIENQAAFTIEHAGIYFVQFTNMHQTTVKRIVVK